MEKPVFDMMTVGHVCMCMYLYLVFREDAQSRKVAVSVLFVAPSVLLSDTSQSALL